MENQICSECNAELLESLKIVVDDAETGEIKQVCECGESNEN